MRPAYEPGYELHCQAQDGPYADDEVTEEVEDFEAMVAAMHRDGTEDDVQPVENQMQQDAAHEARVDLEGELYAKAINIIAELGPQRVAALKNACELELRKWDERNAQERRQIDAAMGKRTRTGRRTRSDAGTKRAPKDGVAA